MRLVVFLSFIIQTVQANEHETANVAAAHAPSHGHMADLLYPGVNFALFFGFLFWKMRKPLGEMFNKMAKEIKDLYEYAEVKSKEAEIKLKMYQDKISNFHSEEIKIQKDAAEEESNFKKSLIEENENQLERTKRETANRIESEKNSLIKSLNEELMDQIISKTKDNISKDSTLKGKVTEKLLSQI